MGRVLIRSVLLVGLASRRRAQLPDSLRGEIFGLTADSAGGLWAVTDRTLVELSRASLLGRRAQAAREFGIADGLPSRAAPGAIAQA